MLKIEGLRWSGAALLVALVTAAPDAAVAGGRAASTRSDGGVSSSGGSSVSRGSSGGSSHGSSSGGSRTAVSRGSGSPSGGASHGGSNGGGRTAVPRSPGADYNVRDRTHGGSHHGGGGHHGGYYGGYYGGYGYYNPWYYGYGPYWGVWGSWYPWGYPGYYAPAYGYGYNYGPADGGGEGYGALDTDIWPEEVEVWIDGERVGTVDDFDGFPSFLWLPRGTYDVVFYLPGFKTLARQYSMYPGVIVDVEDKLERGEAVLPQDLASTSTVNRDARMQRNLEREEAARAREEWRERNEVEEPEYDEEEIGEEEEAPAAQQMGVAVGRLHLRVKPHDASVYLDGNFLGTAREIAQLTAGVVVPPGSHRLQVVRPGFTAEEVTFDSDVGEELQLEVDLDSEE